MVLKDLSTGAEEDLEGKGMMHLWLWFNQVRKHGAASVMATFCWLTLARSPRALGLNHGLRL